MTMQSTPPPSSYDPAHAKRWFEEIVALGPRRVAGSVTEKQAHGVMAEELIKLGLEDTRLVSFRHNRSLYANLALHFLIATLASVALLLGFPPLLCLIAHLFVVLSYGLESNKRLRVLRHIFPWHESQNLISTSPARGELRRRVVIVSHIDAAFTGLIFHPTFLKQALKPPPFEWLMWSRKSMLVATGSVLLLAALDVFALIAPGLLPEWAWVCVVGVVTAPALLTWALNLQIVLKNEIVPGVNDNLTGCYALPYFASRLLRDQPDDVELVFVATGCEEAGTGGAWALVEQSRKAWDPAKTIVVGVDTLSGGTLHYYEEGEFVSFPVPKQLEALIHTELPEVKKYPIPSGATDAFPFLVRDYPAVTFGCVDKSIGAPRHYHYPTDDVAHLDFDQLGHSLEEIERFLRALMEKE